MEERKVMDGVYFTDYRAGSKPKPAADGATARPAEFVTLERVEAISTEDELRYVWSEVLKRCTWLQASTLELFEFPDEWDFIRENVAVLQKYHRMLEVMQAQSKELGLEAMDEKEVQQERLDQEKIEKQYAQMQALFEGGGGTSKADSEQGVFV